MTAGHRFMTYTRLEKACRRMLARRRPARQKLRTLQTLHREILDAIDASAWIGKSQSDSLAPQRHMTAEGRAKTHPLCHRSHTLERTVA
jgi:hypothetical protein